MPEEDTYDLADDAPVTPPPRRTVMTTRGVAIMPGAAPAASPDVPAPAVAGNAPVLGYARPGTVNAGPLAAMSPDARGGAADPLLMKRERRRRFTVPLVLIAVGGLVLYGCGWGISGSLSSGATWASVSVAWDIVIIVAGMLVGSRLVDLELESPLAVLLQVTAIVLADAAVFWPILWLDNGAFCGALIAWIACTLVYCFLLAYFFELEINEVIVLAVVILVVRCLANLAWMSWFGSWGYLPT